MTSFATPLPLAGRGWRVLKPGACGLCRDPDPPLQRRTRKENRTSMPSAQCSSSIVEGVLCLLYVTRRIVYVIPIIISVALVCFLLVHITPGDPLVAVLPADASQELAAAIARRLRLRSSAAGAVRALAVAGGAWRSRPFDRDRPSGARRGDARGKQHRHARDRRRNDRILPRIVLRTDRRLFPRHLGRQGRDLDSDRRRLGAALLVRHGAGDHLFGATQLVAGGRRRSRRLRRLGHGTGSTSAI